MQLGGNRGAEGADGETMSSSKRGSENREVFNMVTGRRYGEGEGLCPQKEKWKEIPNEMKWRDRRGSGTGRHLGRKKSSREEQRPREVNVLRGKGERERVGAADN